jgi:hypothetical protein
MVDIIWVNGELEDVTDEEEEQDEHGNPKFDLGRLNLEGRSHTPSEQRPPPERANGTNTDGGANIGNGPTKMEPRFRTPMQRAGVGGL